MMDNDLIERLAIEAGAAWADPSRMTLVERPECPNIHCFRAALVGESAFARFAALVAEECAKLCVSDEMQERSYAVQAACAEAIRERFGLPNTNLS
jgi:hypothetical protein